MCRCTELYSVSGNVERVKLNRTEERRDGSPRGRREGGEPRDKDGEMERKKKEREKREEGKIVENMESRKRKVWREREVRVR